MGGAAYCPPYLFPIIAEGNIREGVRGGVELPFLDIHRRTPTLQTKLG